MKEPRHDESKVDFQLERLTFFTDGVFAIAITLLVIEIKVPEVTEFSDRALLENLSKVLLNFLGFIISFGIIGYYWSVHHRIFGYVNKCPSMLLWVNFLFLFSIVILPFSSGLVGTFSAHTNMLTPYVIYTINMCFTGFMNCLLWIYVSNPKRDLLTRKIPRSRIKLGVYRSLVIPLVFLISMFFSIFLPVTSRFILLLIPAALHWGMKGLENKADLNDVHSQIHE